MDMVTREMQMEEAVERMKYLGILPQAINAFKKGHVWNSEYNMGILYDTDERTKEQIKKFEEKFNAVVYHTIHNRMNVSGDEYDMTSFLYVSRHPSEWEFDRNDLTTGRPIVYVANNTIPEYSGIGGIGIFPTAGGLGRNNEGYPFNETGRTMKPINPEALKTEMNTIRDWYLAMFPTDDMGKQIRPELTFYDLKEMLIEGKYDAYDIIGVGDSLIRERIFAGLADAEGVTYQDVMNLYHDPEAENPLKGDVVSNDQEV